MDKQKIFIKGFQMAVLSIQSHVVFGYAGNTAAVFPLQRLGREVWAINTVEFSNHTGYGSWRGKVLGAELVSDLVAGLEDRGVLGRCEAVLSGYLGDAASGGAIIDAVKKVKKENPGSLYCCDPVMGDTGRGFYVKPGIPDMFKNELLPLADIVCPNQFELEALTDIKINSVNDAIRAVNVLHERGVSIALVTSFRETEGKLGMIVSDKNNYYKITTPELPLGYGAAGTGDMTSAIFLSRYLETKDIEKTLELCTASIYGILEASYMASGSADLFTASDTNNNFRFELKIIETQKELDSPSRLFKAEKINT
ncbi:MAG: pyridoxal kinase PdxY [Treponema sp.]|nr:pyridoxal kinase PdxY [Treponema sp.]